MVGDIGGTSGKNWGITSLDASTHAAAGPKLTLKRGLGADFLQHFRRSRQREQLPKMPVFKDRRN
jgi:hypothetical protein